MILDDPEAPLKGADGAILDDPDACVFEDVKMIHYYLNEAINGVVCGDEDT